MTPRCTFDFAVPRGCLSTRATSSRRRPSTYRRISGARYRSGSRADERRDVGAPARLPRTARPAARPRRRRPPRRVAAAAAADGRARRALQLLPAEPVARDVQRDLVEPGAQRHRADALGRVGRRARGTPARRRPARPLPRPRACRSGAARRRRGGPGRRRTSPSKDPSRSSASRLRSASSCVAANASPSSLCSGCPITSRNPDAPPGGRATCPEPGAHPLIIMPSSLLLKHGWRAFGCRPPLQAADRTRLARSPTAIRSAWWRLFSMKILPISGRPRIAPAR